MTKPVEIAEPIERLAVGIPGFDQITNGGIPLHRTTLVAGSAGCGKTTFAVQFLVSGVTHYGENGVLVTFEETPEDLKRNVRSFGWGFDEMVEDGRIAVVDVSPDAGEPVIEAGAFDLSALMARIEHAARRVQASRVVLDSIGAIFPQFSDSGVVRRELHRIAVGLKKIWVTTIMTAERTEEYGPVARYGVEEFVADNVAILRNPLEQEKRRRTAEVLKLRGGDHQKGEFPFTIDPREGITILPLSSMEPHQSASEERVSSGNDTLDRMCGGGLFRNSIVLVSGATGTGKTLMVAEFLKAGVEAGERGLLLAYEESRAQIFRNAQAWGVDLRGAEEKGLIRVVSRYPEAVGLEDHLNQVKREVADFQPTRVAIDSMSALERGAAPKIYNEFLIGLTSHLKSQGVTGLLTNTTASLTGGESITDAHVSAVTDSIVLLRYVEIHGEMRRGLAVLKMRGSWHEKAIREYSIDDTGMHVKEAFRGVSGILTGIAARTVSDEVENLGKMFGPKLGAH